MNKFLIDCLWIIAYAIILSLLVMSGCASGNVYSPDAPYTRISPPSHFQTWYEEAESCRNITGDFHLVEFYLVEDLPDTASELGTYGAVGTWTQPHQIYLLSCCWGQESLVKHEMLHDILSYRFGVGPENVEHADSTAFYETVDRITGDPIPACDLSA